MKAFIVLVMVVMIAGCSGYISQEDIEQADKVCEGNNGTKEYRAVFPFAHITHVYCNNGARFGYSIFSKE